MSSNDLYQVLGVGNNANNQELANAFKGKINDINSRHLDVFAFRDAVKRICLAFKVLSTPAVKRQYDQNKNVNAETTFRNELPDLNKFAHVYDILKETKSDNSAAVHLAKEFYYLYDVHEGASVEEVNSSFQRLTDKLENDKGVFQILCIGYQVLTNDDYRRFYDSYGKNFELLERQDFFQKFLNADDLHDKFRSTYLKDTPIYVDFFCTLEELYFGVTKNFTITKNKFGPNKQPLEIITKKIIINVRPGWREGTQIIFEREGDEHIGRVPADITFVLRESKHRFYEREGNNIVYKAHITLKEALKGVEIDLPLLRDGNARGPLRHQKITVQNVIGHGFTYTLKGQGFPKLINDDSNKQHQYGDFIIKFLVRFPNTLTDEQRAEIARMLPEH